MQTKLNEIILKHKWQWIKLTVSFQFVFHLSSKQKHFKGTEIREHYSEHYQSLSSIRWPYHSIQTKELMLSLLRYFALW